jgi:L-asparaginase
MQKTLVTTKHEILVFATGGTIEKTYNEFDGSLENRGTSIKNRIHSKLRLPATQIEVWPLMSKDSLYMTDQDR